MYQRTFLLVCYAAQLLCITANIPCVTYNLTLSLEEAVHVSDIVMTGRVIGQLAAGERGTMTGRISYYYAYKNDAQLTRLLLGSTDLKNFLSAEKLGEIALFFVLREPDGGLALQCMSPFTLLVPGQRSSIGQAGTGRSSISTLLHRVGQIGRDVPNDDS